MSLKTKEMRKRAKNYRPPTEAKQYRMPESHKSPFEILRELSAKMALRGGVEPTVSASTAQRSTVELSQHRRK